MDDVTKTVAQLEKEWQEFWAQKMPTSWHSTAYEQFIFGKLAQLIVENNKHAMLIIELRKELQTIKPVRIVADGKISNSL